MPSFVRVEPVRQQTETCSANGQERCLPCLREPLQKGHVYRTRDGLYRFRVEYTENCRWNGSRAFATMLSASGFPIYDKSFFFGKYGEFCYPRNVSSPTDLVAEVAA